MRQRLIERARRPIRDRAIKRVKTQIAQQNRCAEDFAEDELEDLVAAEEEKIRRGLWGAPILVLLGLLGLA